MEPYCFYISGIKNIMEILFVRHAEKNTELEDGPLTEKGVKQAKVLAKRLSKEKFDEFYCSNLKRAKETSKFISEKIGLAPVVEESLNEFESNLLKTNQIDWNKRDKVHYNSLKKFILSLTERSEENKRILIVAHGITNRFILAIALELDARNLIRFRLFETGISEIYWEKKFKNWRLNYWNDFTHQPKELVGGKDRR